MSPARLPDIIPKSTDDPRQRAKSSSGPYNPLIICPFQWDCLRRQTPGPRGIFNYEHCLE